MIVHIAISQKSLDAMGKFADAQELLPAACEAGLTAATAATAVRISELLQTHALPLKSRRGGEGLAGAISAWIDGGKHYIGVPANTEASAYAAIHEYGGIIRPRRAKALAIPLNERAAMYTSPRDAEADNVDLQYIKRAGKPPLLAQIMGDQVTPWYVLVKKVTIAATRWFSQGIEQTGDVRMRAFDMAVSKMLERVNG